MLIILECKTRQSLICVLWGLVRYNYDRGKKSRKLWLKLRIARKLKIARDPFVLFILPASF